MVSSRWYPAETITDSDCEDDPALLAYTPAQAESLLHSIEQTAIYTGLFVNLDKTELMCFNHNGTISSLNGKLPKLVDQFTYLGSNISFTENEADTLI